MKPLYAILLLLAGCSTPIPSMKYCSVFDYHRENNRFTLHAECALPVEQPAIPSPVDLVKSMF